MNREQIINQLVQDPEYKKICQTVTPDYADDLYQDLLLYVLEFPEDKLVKLNSECLKCYWFRMAQKQFQSKNSKFYRQYLRTGRVIHDHQDDVLQAAASAEPDIDLIDKTQTAAQDLYWYDAGILDLYLEYGNLRAVSKATGIPLKSVCNTINSVRKFIKKKINGYE